MTLHRTKNSEGEELMWSYSIADFGAIGDDQTKNTKAIQAAIDMCHGSGGGQVVVPPGIFVTGSIFLKDNVDLHLLPGAELKGSPDIEDYNADDCFEQNRAFTSENVTGAHLIMAIEVTNVSITGRGRINGNSAAFFGPPVNECGNFSIRDKRPGQMVYFVECRNICLDGVGLDNATYWTLFVHGCDTVTIRAVRISNHRRTQNGDGIDVDCSRNVTISDCLIFSGDDSITLRADNEALKDKSRVCENVVVSNCVLSTPCNAIRVGVGEGIIQNCSFSNIVIRNTLNGICLVSSYVKEHKQGATIRNIRFSNITMEAVMPFYIASQFDAAAPIENIHFDNISTTTSKTSFIFGNNKAVFRNINFRNVEVEVSGGGAYMEDRAIDLTVHQEWLKGYNTAFLVANTDQVRFVDFRLKWGELDAPWRHCVVANNSTGLELETNHLASPCGAVDELIVLDRDCE